MRHAKHNTHIYARHVATGKVGALHQAIPKEITMQRSNAKVFKNPNPI